MGFRNRLNFPPGSITRDMLADGSVTGPKLAFDAIDGKTITGALFRTAATGRRWEMDSVNIADIRGYTGTAAEVSPGGLRTAADTTALVSPDLGAGRSFLDMTGTTTANSATLTGGSVYLRTPDALNQIYVDPTDGPTLWAAGGRNQIWANGGGAVLDTSVGPDPIALRSGVGGINLTTPGAVKVNAVPVVTTTDAQALSSKDLSGASNKMPFRGGTGDFVVSSTATAGSAGRITVPHGLGVTPTWATMSVLGVSSLISAPVAFTATTVAFDITYRDLSGMPPANGSTVTVCWLAGITTA